jgi:hypothetical protein
MSTANIVGGAADGGLVKTAYDDWTTCMAATPSAENTTAAGLYVQKKYPSNKWYVIKRAYFLFDMAAYAGAAISAATLHLSIYTYNSYAVTCYYNNWGGTLAAGDWGNKGAAASDSFTPTGGYTTYNLTLANPQNLLTYAGGIELVLDDETTQPTADENCLYVRMSENTTYKPNLDITYTLTSCPVNLLHSRIIGKGVRVNG